MAHQHNIGHSVFFSLGLVLGLQCTLVPFSPFPFMLFICYYFTITMYFNLNGMNKLKLKLNKNNPR